MKRIKALVLIVRRLRDWKRRPQLVCQQEHNKKQMLKAFLIYRMLKRKESMLQKRRFWVHPIFTEKRRFLQGASNNLIREMEHVDTDKYIEYLRMNVSTFNELLKLIQSRIEKQYAVRSPICASTRLHICLRYLASGDSMPSISFAFRVGLNTVSNIISETCNAIWDVLKDSVFPEITEDMWRQKAKEFEIKWNFPNCIGAIDGRHMGLVAPPHSGSTYYNYKGTHSIVLLAVADANCCFTAVDIGAEGRRSDGGVLFESELGRHLNNNSLNLPSPSPIEENGEKLPFVLVGDEAFALSSYMMRPYPRAHTLNLQKKVFNYRLSRARRIVECAFGILTSRWRIFRRPMTTSVKNAMAIIKATVCLHNFLMEKDLQLPIENREYAINNSTEDTNISRCVFQALNHPPIEIGKRNLNAVNIRDAFGKFFCSLQGSIEQQWEKALQNDF